MRPLARSENLLIREMEDEIVVYDLDRKKAHCLNGTAATVWKNADGRQTIGELTALLHTEVGAPMDDGVVWLALRRLRAAHLLDETSVTPHEIPAVTRREVVQRLGLGAAAAGALMPVISSLLAPTAAQATGSCLDPGSACTDGPQCCSGVCDSAAGVCV